MTGDLDVSKMLASLKCIYVFHKCIESSDSYLYFLFFDGKYKISKLFGWKDIFFHWISTHSIGTYKVVMFLIRNVIVGVKQTLNT